MTYRELKSAEDRLLRLLRSPLRRTFMSVRITHLRRSRLQYRWLIDPGCANVYGVDSGSMTVPVGRIVLNQAFYQRHNLRGSIWLFNEDGRGW